MTNVNKKLISWITPEYFLDTDIFTIKNLCSKYRINWFIIRQSCRNIDFIDVIENLRANGVNVVFFPIHKHSIDPRNLVLFFKLANYIKRSGSVFLFTSLAYPPFFLPVLAQVVGVEMLTLGIHNVHVPKGATHYLRNCLYNKYAIGKFREFLVYSLSQKNLLLSIKYEAKVYYIPFFLKDYGEVVSSANHEYITFMNFGNIRDYKRLDILIEAAQDAFEETNIMFKVIIAGKCDCWDKYLKLIRYRELFDLRIQRIEDSDIPNLFAETDYFVAPYQDIAQSGSAIVALNYNVPIIASRLPAFEEYVEDGKTGFLMKPADRNELKDIIIEILKSSNSYHDMFVSNIIENKKMIFDTDNTIRKYEELIDETIR